MQRLKVELATCRQHGLTIVAYYGKLMQLWTSLTKYQKSMNCDCPIGAER